MFGKIKLKAENEYLHQENEQLKREVVKLRKELKSKHDALMAVTEPQFNKFKEMSLSDVIQIMDGPNVDFGDFMYFVNYILPLIKDVEKTFNELKNIRSSSEE